MIIKRDPMKLLLLKLKRRSLLKQMDNLKTRIIETEEQIIVEQNELLKEQANEFKQIKRVL